MKIEDHVETALTPETWARVLAHLPQWAQDLVRQLDRQARNAQRYRDQAEAALAEYTDKENVATGGGTPFEYDIHDQTYPIPDDAIVTANLGGGRSLGLTVENGRLTVDGVSGINCYPVAGNSLSVGER